jgi:hypothetical protein
VNDTRLPLFHVDKDYLPINASSNIGAGLVAVLALYAVGRGLSSLVNSRTKQGE